MSGSSRSPHTPSAAPAVFEPMLAYIETLSVKPDFSRTRLMPGATEPPLSMMRGFRDLTGADIVHGLSDEEQLYLKRCQELPLNAVDGADLPIDEVHRYVDRLPRTSVGKLDKKVMRAEYADIYKAEQ